jgi:hypothetical protein
MLRSSPTANSGLRIEQTYLKHEEYLLHLHSLFLTLVKENSQPKIFVRNPDKRTGKAYSTIRFHTRHLPCLNEFFELFYISNGIGSYTKIVSKTISKYITPAGLAY